MDLFLKACPLRQIKKDQLTAKPEDDSHCFQDKMHLPNPNTLHITDLPPEVMHQILRNLKFENIAKLRLVCKHFNSICSFLLNTEFNHLRTTILMKFQAIKSLMPRRESARRKHPLARESDIIETLHMRLSLLHMSFGKHIERKYCCFFPGEIIDEIYNVLQYIKSTPNLNRAYKVTDELFDLSTMAMEYFKECIEPTLPEVSFLTTELLEHSSIIRPSTDLTINKSQLLSLECSNTIQDILVKPTNDHLEKFRKQLKKTKEIAAKNRKDIVKMERSVESARQRITAVIKELHQIKCLHKNDRGKLLTKYSSIKSFLLEAKGQHQEAPSCSSNSNFLSPNLKFSEALSICKSGTLCDKIPKKTSKNNVKRSFDSFDADTSSQNEAILEYNLAAESDNKLISAELMMEYLTNKKPLKKMKRL